MASHFLFFTGEPAVTLPMLKPHPSWSPVLSAIQVYVTQGRVHRKNSAEDDYRGVLYCADVRDKDIERHNLHTFLKHAVPCWPEPNTLLRLSDRHDALAQCQVANLLQHKIVQTHFTREPLLPFPYVLKIGDEHRGEGKYLIRSAEDIPRWEGIATAEPFFEGESVRVLVLGDQMFGVRLQHDHHWIKNSTGGRFEPWEPPRAIADHARKAAALFGLEIAGVDYVVAPHEFHFIELNPFPRVGITKETAQVATQIFLRAMARIEAQARRRAL